MSCPVILLAALVPALNGTLAGQVSSLAPSRCSSLDACATWQVSSGDSVFGVVFKGAHTSIATSSSVRPEIDLSVVAWGRTGDIAPAEEPSVDAHAEMVILRRGPFTERFVRLGSGLRHEFVVSDRIGPAADALGSTAPLEILVEFRGEYTPSALSGDRDIVLRSSDGLRLCSYSGLGAWDATGRELPARFVVENQCARIQIDDDGARYPVRIDPLIVVEEATLKASDSTPPGFTNYADSVSVVGDTCAVGWPGSNTPLGAAAGAAYVYARSGSAWLQEAKLTADDGQPNAALGISVAADYNIIVAGASAQDLPGLANAGAAYVFERSGGGWAQTARLTASDAAPGDAFGSAIALQGDTLAIGARAKPSTAGGFPVLGAIYIFTNVGGVWTEQTKLTAATTQLGVQLSLDGDTLVAGTPAYSGFGSLPTNTGAVVVFRRTSGAWSQEAFLPGPAFQRDLHFGHSTSVSGDSLFIGAWGSNFGTGRVWVYERVGTTWGFAAMLSLVGGAQADAFGYSVAVIGRTGLISALGRTGNGIPGAGVIYIYERLGGAWTETNHFSAANSPNQLRLGKSLSFDGVTLVSGAQSFSTAGAAYVFRLAWPSFCFGDGSMATPCPCAVPDVVPSPSGAPRSGCANSLNFGGGRLTASGVTDPDHVAFRAFIAPNYSGFALLTKGDAQSPAGIANGDGVRCVDGAMIRFGGHNAGAVGESIGFWRYPNALQTATVSAATGQIPGQTAYYQLLYRNAEAGFCSPATVNWTGATRIEW